MNKSLVRALEPPACGCLAGVFGGLLGGVISCWPFSAITAIFGGPTGLLLGIAAGFSRNDRLWRASSCGFLGGMAVGLAFGLYCRMYAVGL